MEENLKKLLLKDLCCRLPYKVKCKYSREIPMIGEVTNNIGMLSNIYVDKECPFEINGGIYGFADVKPYLRSMSSMTEEEKKEFSKLLVKRYCEEDWEGHISTSYCIEIDNVYTDDEDGIKYPSAFSMDAIDWLNAHHFDYRGLIEKGLALEAVEGMYK